MLAAQQELEKLGLLANGEPIGADLVLRSVGDSARYDVFQLAEAAAAGDAARALRVLLGLKSEGVEPTLILWALLRELRGHVAGARARPVALLQSRGSGWNLAAHAVAARAVAAEEAAAWRPCCCRRAIPTASSRDWRRAMRGARSPA